jgi:hypothetical protein
MASITPEVLEALLSPNGSVRQQAESHFHALTLTDRVQGLMGRLVDTASPPQHQLLSAVLLRRDILKLTDITMLQELLSPLLRCFFASPDSKMAVGHCLAEVVAVWNVLQDVTPVLAQMMAALQPSLANQDVASLKLLANVAQRAPVAFTQLAIVNHNLVPSLVQNQPNLNFSPLALEAVVELVVHAAIASVSTGPNENKKTATSSPLVVDSNSLAATTLSVTLPTLLSQLQACSNADVVQKSLEHLTQAAVSCPSLIAGNVQVLQTALQACLNMPQAPLAALQLVASMVSVRDVKGRILPAHAQQLTSLVTQALLQAAQLLITTVDDDVEDWANEPASLLGDNNNSAMEEEYDTLYAESICQELLQHHSGALPELLPLVSSWFSHQDWKYQRAGIALMECALESTPIQLAPHAHGIVQAVLTIMGQETAQTVNVNVRVQYQAVQLLGALCQTKGYYGAVQQAYAKPILECLASAVANPCSQVSSMASLALVSYCRGEDTDADICQSVTPYLQDVLQALVVAGPLSWDRTDVGAITCQVRAVGAIACLAQATEESFQSFYTNVMPGLLGLAQSQNVDLAGAAVQAATIVGQAVGIEYFEQDAQQLMQWMLPVLQQSNENSSPQPMEQLLSACARIASVLGEAFLPYVNVVLPHLLQRASEPPDVSVIEGTEAGLDQEVELDSELGTESMTVALPGRGLTKVTINTTKIQEKSMATRAVYEHAAALRAAFGPYAETCFPVFLPLLSFQYSADVRGAAAQTLAAIFDAACLYGEQTGSMQLPQHYFPLVATALAKQVAEEETADMEALYAMADALSEMYYIVYRYKDDESGRVLLQDLNMELANNSVRFCIKAMVACLERRSEMTGILSSGAVTSEDEREEYIELLRLEEQLLTPLVDSVGYTLKFLGHSFVPIFAEHVVPVLGPYLATNIDIRASVSAVCLFDDCVEHCGPQAAAKYAPQLVQGVLLAMQNNADKDLVQAAVYGIAQMARHAPGTVMAEHIQIIVHNLLEIASLAKDDDNIYLVENAVSALASLTLWGPFVALKFGNRDALTQTFLSQLPLGQDEDEAKVCTEQTMGRYWNQNEFSPSH